MDEVLERPELKEVTDGILAKLGDTGRIVLRKSGTEPLVRIMVEAQTDEECEKYCNEIKDKIFLGETVPGTRCEPGTSFIIGA